MNDSDSRCEAIEALVREQLARLGGRHGHERNSSLSKYSDGDLEKIWFKLHREQVAFEQEQAQVAARNAEQQASVWLKTRQDRLKAAAAKRAALAKLERSPGFMLAPYNSSRSHWPQFHQPTRDDFQSSDVRYALHICDFDPDSDGERLTFSAPS